MSDAERAPVIRLNVDQEVFIPAVREGDRVEDATVATEVTSFDRVGDAYVLEGAIVFAGYLTHSGADAPGAEDSFTLDFGDTSFGQHVHHRMPFVLRVPVKVQPRGIVNVASRITQWKLDVSGPGWVRVLAELHIVGLNGGQGYHFQCGAQEAGDLFFQSGAPNGATAPGADAAQEAGQPAEDWGAKPLWTEPQEEAPYALTRGVGHGQTEDFERAVSDGIDFETVEAVSQARQGAPLDDADDAVRAEAEGEVVDPGAPDTVDAVGEAAQGEDPAGPRSDAAGVGAAQDEAGERSRLAGFDRLLDGASPGEDTPAASVPPSPQAVAGDAPAADDDLLDRPWTMEFEHQLAPEDLHQAANAGPSGMGGAPGAGDERFFASRSFSEHGFQAAAGFVQTTGGAAANTAGSGAAAGPAPSASRGRDAAPSPGPDAGRAQETAYPEAADATGRSEQPAVDNHLWSFVDFNAPERTYTLRFAIVMEDETLESVAERLGVTKADLMRVNRLTSDTVYAGQCLRVPVPVTAR
ncbi:LysM peptidoglycan-binding domain-containing protein [Alicyclobacillus sp.]|uniref:LysM peptidoglycan-binding domain-containing protein n=1 Tax=Alicyclobacillus sp. TaxID=61169 RepID=UPI0025BD2635|nr:LysM peptidoglycan-binding domain-containing protein [Alicyclobacillus sp.]MCL6517736.1 LysM peptidoglycan-binding domain-containing protein [Alicyclobacillus sp.]